MFKLLGLIFLLLGLSGCQTATKEKIYSAAQIDSLSNAFQVHLTNIETEFKNESWSPLTDEDKQLFKHINYYPYDISWRFEGPIQIYENPDSMIILGSKKGDERPALKYGYFHFEKDGKQNRLEIIKIFPTRPGHEAHLFLGFWDETSGNETYSGGRYVDIAENDDNFYTIDFNYSYNPYCAYSARYSCAVPPFENRLEIAITAGEKIFKEH